MRVRRQRSPGGLSLISVKEPLPFFHVATDGNDTAQGSRDRPLATIAAAKAKLTVYSGGVGGGTIMLGPGTFTETVAYNQSGMYIEGVGKHATIIRGNVAGPIISSPAGGDFINPQNSFGGLRGVYVINDSTSAAARAIELQQFSEFKSEDTHYQSAGGFIGRLRGVISTDFTKCRFGGIAGADHAMFLDGTDSANAGAHAAQNTTIGFHQTAFSDAKAGIDILSAVDVVIDQACQFASFAGGAASHSQAIAIDGLQGGVIVGDYFESCPMAGIVIYQAIRLSRGLVVGGHYMTNMGSPFIDGSGATHSMFFPNEMIPGANSANANGLVVSGVPAVSNVYHPQHLATGTGTALSVPATAGFIFGTKPTVAGSRGANVALASLLTGLASMGLLTDSSVV